MLSAVPQTVSYESVALAAGVPHHPRTQGRHLAVHRALWQAALRLRPPLEGLDLAQAEVLVVHSVVPDVDELAQLTRPVVAGELDLLLGEPSLKLSTRLVLRRVAVQDLHHEDGELLVGSRAHGDPDPVHHWVILQLNLKL